jgi:uncharacterized protein (DUF2267 family)
MSTTRVDVIDRSVANTRIWLGQLAEELGGDDRQYAYWVLRAVLRGLLTPETMLDAG